MMVLVDNTVLSNFALVNQIHLLTTALGEKVSITPQVLEEFKEGIARGRLPQTNLDRIKVIKLEEEEITHFQVLSNHVNIGEASCLAIASKRNAQFLTDDRDARKLAAQLMVPVSGTIGILLRLIQLDALSYVEANTILNQMIVKGYRSPVQKLEEL